VRDRLFLEQSDFFDAMFADIPPDLALQRDTMRTSSLGQDPSPLAGADIAPPPRPQNVQAENA